MKYAYKTEIKPTAEQIEKIKRSMGICRWLYNKYLETNKKLYKMYQRGLLDKNQSYFMTANDFDKYVNNKLKKQEKYSWINKCGSKARKKILMNAECAYKNYFAGNTAFPKFKKKNDGDAKLYFPKNNAGDWIVERHRIKVPTLKYVRLKEYGYLPTDAKVINGTISQNADRFYVSITVEKETAKYKADINFVALNIKISETDVYSLNKKLSLQKRKLKKKTGIKNKQKQQQKIKKLEQKIRFIKEDYLNKQIAKVISLKPQYLIMENLNINSLTADNKMKRLMIKQKYYDLKNRLLIKCSKYNIELKQTNVLEDKKENIVSINVI